jgi:hypothetical protein
MKSAQEHLEQLDSMQISDVLPWIKDIQDEAFKAGMKEAAGLATDWESAEAAIRAILREIDKLP